MEGERTNWAFGRIGSYRPRASFPVALDKVHGELRNGSDVPPAGRILKADDQLLPERAPYLHEGLY